ncbi:MAG: hypothetical protein P8X89_15325 [Reinekea sp.]
MDYLSVAQSANIAVFVTASFLLGLLVFQSVRVSWKRLLLPGLLGQFLWSGGQFASYRIDLNPIVLLNLEVIRLALWLLSLFLLLAKRTPVITWPAKSKIIALIGTATAVAGGAYVNASGSAAGPIRLFLMFMAIFALVFTEQVVRNLNTHRMIKLLGLCLSLLFVYDTFMYGQSAITLAISATLTQGRTALAFLVATSLTVGALIFNEKSDNQYIFS